jgi:hypothetical protein
MYAIIRSDEDSRRGLLSTIRALEFTYLVPNSSIHNIAEADRPGVRIAVVRNHVSTLAHTRLLKQSNAGVR